MLRIEEQNFECNSQEEEKKSFVTSKRTVVFSVPVEAQSAGEESTTRVSLYKFGNT